MLEGLLLISADEIAFVLHQDGRNILAVHLVAVLLDDAFPLERFLQTRLIGDVRHNDATLSLNN